LSLGACYCYGTCSAFNQDKPFGVLLKTGFKVNTIA
jgi:hypothetical protein